MKKAVGELNATIAVVMLIGIMAVFFFTVLWPSINNTLIRNTRCSDAMCDANSVGADGMADCVYKDKKGNRYNLECVWKG